MLLEQVQTLCDEKFKVKEECENETKELDYKVEKARKEREELDRQVKELSNNISK